MIYTSSWYCLCQLCFAAAFRASSRDWFARGPGDLIVVCPKFIFPAYIHCTCNCPDKLVKNSVMPFREQLELN